MDKQEAVGAGAAILPPTSAHGALAPTLSRPDEEKDGTDLQAGPSSKMADHDMQITPMPILQPTISKTVEAVGPVSTRTPMSTIHLIVVAALVTFTLCMSAAGAMTLTIALPTIQDELGMDEHDLQWITAAYSLTNGCFLLLSGRLADVHGRKLVFLVSGTDEPG